MKAQCKYCSFCKQHGRMQTQRGQLGRKKYYCKHPQALSLMDRGLPLNTFVGFGTKDFASPLAIKTSKRWCPLT